MKKLSNTSDGVQRSAVQPATGLRRVIKSDEAAKNIYVALKREKNLPAVEKNIFVRFVRYT